MRRPLRPPCRAPSLDAGRCRLILASACRAGASPARWWPSWSPRGAARQSWVRAGGASCQGLALALDSVLPCAHLLVHGAHGPRPRAVPCAPQLTRFPQPFVGLTLPPNGTFVLPTPCRRAEAGGREGHRHLLPGPLRPAHAAHDRALRAAAAPDQAGEEGVAPATCQQGPGWPGHAPGPLRARRCRQRARLERGWASMVPGTAADLSVCALPLPCPSPSTA